MHNQTLMANNETTFLPLIIFCSRIYQNFATVLAVLDNYYIDML